MVECLDIMKCDDAVISPVIKFHQLFFHRIPAQQLRMGDKEILSPAPSSRIGRIVSSFRVTSSIFDTHIGSSSSIKTNVKTEIHLGKSIQDTWENIQLRQLLSAIMERKGDEMVEAILFRLTDRHHLLLWIMEVTEQVYCHVGIETKLVSVTKKPGDRNQRNIKDSEK